MSAFLATVLTLIVSPMAMAGQFLSLETAVKIAREANPGLAAKRALADAFEEVPSQAGALPDPVLMLNAMNLPTDTFSTSQENMTQFQVGVAQAFPYPGKLALLEESASHIARGMRSEQIDYENNVVRQVRIVWWNILFFDRAVEIVRRNQDLLRQFVKIAEMKYMLGNGLQQDVLLAQLELSKLLDREIRLVSMREQMVARLNALMDQPASTAIILPPEVNETLPFMLDDKELQAYALQSRPLLSARASQSRAAKARLRHSEKGYMPDFKLGALYGRRDDNPQTGDSRADMASIKLSITIPLYGDVKQARAIAQRSSELMAADREYDEAKNRVLAAVVRISSEYRKARAQAELFRTGIIPQAEQTVESMRAGYQVNKVDFLNLVRAQITLYKYETDYWKTIASANQALAALKATVGQENVYE